MCFVLLSGYPRNVNIQSYESLKSVIIVFSPGSAKTSVQPWMSSSQPGCCVCSVLEFLHSFWPSHREQQHFYEVSACWDLLKYMLLCLLSLPCIQTFHRDPFAFALSSSFRSWFLRTDCCVWSCGWYLLLLLVCWRWACCLPLASCLSNPFLASLVNHCFSFAHWDFRHVHYLRL